jgi:hypothetical protein
MVGYRQAMCELEALIAFAPPDGTKLSLTAQNWLAGPTAPTAPASSNRSTAGATAGKGNRTVAARNSNSLAKVPIRAQTQRELFCAHSCDF